MLRRKNRDLALESASVQGWGVKEIGYPETVCRERGRKSRGFKYRQRLFMERQRAQKEPGDWK